MDPFLSPTEDTCDASKMYSSTVEGGAQDLCSKHPSASSTVIMFLKVL